MMMETMQGRKQRRQIVMQSLRLMMLSGVVRPATVDPPYLVIPEAARPDAQEEPTTPARQLALLRRAVVSVLAFLFISLWMGTPAEAVRR